jgi:murein DD-endopeptidase MepM/ murein hydrolase activator NlpD
LHTIIPDRERLTPTAYWVQAGDTLFGVADKFGLRPESILLNNYELFEDDPHRLEAGQLLQIPAVDGILYIWHAGDGVVGVASFFGVTPETIIDWPGNDLPADLDLEDPDIESGTQIMIPGGQRKVADWRTPRIRRANPSSARILGPGACDSAYDGPVGSGNFTWPLAGSIQIQYRFDPVIHPAIDLYAPGAHDVLAVDAGVVVYSGGHDWGLGHMVVLDHGNGWQSLYADLAQVDVVCGQSVFQGDRIAALEAGNGAELPVLHLEILQDEFGKVDPVSFFP